MLPFIGRVQRNFNDKKEKCVFVSNNEVTKCYKLYDQEIGS